MAVFPTVLQSGFRLADDDAINTALVTDMRSTDNGATALGTNQATAYQIVASITRFTTVGAGTGCKLPKPLPGLVVTIFNYGVNALRVYGNAGDSIDTVAGATGVPLTNALRAMFICTSPTTWISAQLGVVSA